MNITKITVKKIEGQQTLRGVASVVLDDEIKIRDIKILERAGTLFADYRNAVIGLDDNYVIYGHNMKDGTMFSSLIKYKQQSYYDERSVNYFLDKNRLQYSYMTRKAHGNYFFCVIFEFFC